jgi:hypothetical protein
MIEYGMYIVTNKAKRYTAWGADAVLARPTTSSTYCLEGEDLMPAP